MSTSFITSAGTPGGIRTLDLRLERAASLAARRRELERATGLEPVTFYLASRRTSICAKPAGAVGRIRTSDLHDVNVAP